MGATTLTNIEKTDIKDKVENTQSTSTTDIKNGLDLSIDETKFILAKLAQMEYKGVEIEFIYLLLGKIQIYLQESLDKQSK